MNFLNSKSWIQFAAFFICIFIAFTAVAEEQKAAEINGVVITQEQFDKELNIHLDRVAKQGRQVPDDKLADLKNDILEGLIEREMLYQESKKVGIKING